MKSHRESSPSGEVLIVNEVDHVMICLVELILGLMFPYLNLKDGALTNAVRLCRIICLQSYKISGPGSYH